MKKAETPKPKKESLTLSSHGDDRIDDYYWMRLSDEQKESQNADQQTTDVLHYLNTENKYLKNQMKHTTTLLHLLK